MNARGEKALIRINVADAGKKRLIQQQSFYTSFALNAFPKLFERNLKRLGTKPRNAWGNFLRPLDGSKLSRVVIMQHTVFQREHAVDVFGRRVLQEEFARHSEMHRQESAIQRDLNEFATPRNGLNFAAD
jgi:hypothetical protein